MNQTQKFKGGNALKERRKAKFELISENETSEPQWRGRCSLRAAGYHAVTAFSPWSVIVRFALIDWGYKADIIASAYITLRPVDLRVVCEM